MARAAEVFSVWPMSLLLSLLAVCALILPLAWYEKT